MGSNHEITVSVNGTGYTRSVSARTSLADFLRDALGLTGTHIGCETTVCGACTVHLDGRAVKSCTMFAVQADGRQVTTVESLAVGGLHPIQEGFKQEHGLQCGFCTPGMMMSTFALLQEKPDPTEEEIRWALSGNICRCTGYMNIVKSVRYAAQKMKAAAAVPVEAGARS
ncbi:MAG TPA: (2Fe-2S)-binding protein [Candidatus Dormibacteraeota bacterium]|nr:(2Fe-2S)-binding protein [Candidatus Dormibacteraeota bacterium]